MSYPGTTMIRIRIQSASKQFFFKPTILWIQNFLFYLEQLKKQWDFYFFCNNILIDVLQYNLYAKRIKFILSTNKNKNFLYNNTKER